ncbi:minor tail protein [Gordonia phage Nedarya]|nr:minor tail protein [Gordonia phage Nedarya]
MISQEDHNPNDPEEHFLWGLFNMPMMFGVGGITNTGILRRWSKHLWDCGFVHRDYLVGLADENGMIHVSQLPKQIIKLQKAFRGPRHNLNPAARWVTKDTPDPEPVRIPDIRKLTDQENEAMIQQYISAGRIRVGSAGPELAQEIT